MLKAWSGVHMGWHLEPLETCGEQTFREPRYPGVEQEMVLPLQVGVAKTQGVRHLAHSTERCLIE